MVKGYLSLAAWLLDLIDPPLRSGMSVGQKIGRSFIITGALVIACTMLSLIIASILAVLQQVLLVTGDSETLARAVAIILISICGNTICIITLMEMRRIDRRNISKAD